MIFYLQAKTSNVQSPHWFNFLRKPLLPLSPSQMSCIQSCACIAWTQRAWFENNWCACAYRAPGRALRRAASWMLIKNTYAVRLCGIRVSRLYSAGSARAKQKQHIVPCDKKWTAHRAVLNNDIGQVKSGICKKRLLVHFITLTTIWKWLEEDAAVELQQMKRGWRRKLSILRTLKTYCRSKGIAQPMTKLTQALVFAHSQKGRDVINRFRSVQRCERSVLRSWWERSFL